MYCSNNIESLIDDLSNKKVIIYGAGKIGKRIYQTLKKDNISIDRFWDNNYSLHTSIDEVPVDKPNLEFLEKDNVFIIVTIYAKNVTEEIVSQLSASGFKNILYDRQTINNLIYGECAKEVQRHTHIFDLNRCHICPVSKDLDDRCDIYDRFVEKELMVSSKNSSGVIIPSMGILVSNRCNLKCIGCNQLRDFYKKSDIVDIKAVDVISDVMKISNAVGKIEKIVVVGGEALLHKEINVIIEKLISIPNVGILQFITNGSVLPKNDLIFSLLSNKKVKVEVSGYGDFLSSNAKSNVVSVLKKLEKYSVNFEYEKTLQWFDFGDFQDRKYSPERLKHVYDTCCFVSNDLFNGELHKCARSVFGKHLGKVADFKNDYVDIRNSKDEELSEIINEFMKNRTPQICQHCNGTSSLTISAGKQ